MWVAPTHTHNATHAARRRQGLAPHPRCLVIVSRALPGVQSRALVRRKCRVQAGRTESVMRWCGGWLGVPLVWGVCVAGGEGLCYCRVADAGGHIAPVPLGASARASGGVVRTKRSASRETAAGVCVLLVIRCPRTPDHPRIENKKKYAMCWCAYMHGCSHSVQQLQPDLAAVPVRP